MVDKVKHWKIFCGVLPIYCASIIWLTLCTHLHLHANLARRTIGRRLEPFQKNNVVSEIGDRCRSKYFQFILQRIKPRLSIQSLSIQKINVNLRRVLGCHLPEVSSSNSDITSITVVHVQHFPITETSWMFYRRSHIRFPLLSQSKNKKSKFWLSFKIRNMSPVFATVTFWDQAVLIYWNWLCLFSLLTAN
jgi:hypothetical protein